MTNPWKSIVLIDDFIGKRSVFSIFMYIYVSLPQGHTRVFLLALTRATQEWHSECQSSSEIYRMLQAAGFEAQCLVEKYIFLIVGCLWKTNTRVTKMKECRAFCEASIQKLWFITNYVNSRKDELLASTEIFIFSFWMGKHRAKRYYIKVRRTMSFRAARQPIAWFYCQWICGIDRVGRFLSRIHGVPNPDTA